MNDFFRGIEDIVEALKRAKQEDVKVNLLIGAGCSVTANIPAASGIVNEIKKRYPLDYKKAKEKNYAECMSKLTPPERRRLITEFVKCSHVNWAHLSIAQLIKNGYIDRVLTTNFDNLILRACSIVGEFPAVYDLATSTEFRSDLLFDKSILHLHGQYTGFILCNTKDELDEQRKNLEVVFNELKRKSLWIIVGYSGQNDAILELLSTEKTFEHRLFWVGFNEEEPLEELKAKLLGENKFAFYTKGYDADKFFKELTKRLNCYPPKLFEKPFSYLKDTVNTIKEYTEEDSKSPFSTYNINVLARNIIQEAIDYYESNNVTMANYYIKMGVIDKFLSLYEKCNISEKIQINTNFKEVLASIACNAKEYIKRYEKEEPTSLNDRDLINLIKAYSYVSNIDGDEESLKYLIQARNICKTYIDNNTYNETVLTEYVNILIQCGNLSVDLEEKIQFYKEAENIYIEIDKYDNGNINNLIEWSNLLVCIAEEYEDNNDLSNQYVNDATELLDRAHNIDKKNSKILVNWGNLLIQKTSICKCNCEEIVDLANEKFKLACNLEPDNIYNKLYWANSLFEIISTDISDEALLKFLIIASNNYNSALEENRENCGIIGEWISSLKDLNEAKDNVYFYQIYSIFINTIKKLIDCSSNEIIHDIVEMLNEFAYFLIYKDEMDISKEILDLCINSGVNNEYLHLATLGLWFFRNENIEVEVSEINGKLQYEKSINFTETEKDKILLNALKQKYNNEYSYFLFKRKGNVEDAIEYFKKAYSYKKIEGFEKIYDEVLKMKDTLELGEHEAATSKSE